MSAQPTFESTELPPTIVEVSLGDRAYPIVVGRCVSGEAGARIAALGARAVGLVTDETVGPLHGAGLQASLSGAGLRVVAASVPSGEGSKRFDRLEALCETLLAGRLERGDVVLALGGGVVGDLAGFAAAVLLRGIRFVQVPTTLLAQVDSSVGGKTGINARAGKNLIGAFHQPALVLADTALLDTLSPREMRAGYAETVKYGLIGDPAFYEWCEAHWQEVLAGGPARDRAVVESCRAKATVVARDEREERDRALLNLGHTFGHALERAVGYDGARLVHGEGVAIGMAQAFRFSARLGLCPPEEAARIERHLAAAGLPTRPGQVAGGVGTADTLMDAMAQDKKVRAGRLTFILARGIGRSFVSRDVEPGDLRAFLEDDLGASAAPDQARA